MNLLLIDDHALFREGLKFLLRDLDEHLVIDGAESCAAATLRPGSFLKDLILLDLNLPEFRGLEPLARIRLAFPNAPVVALSGEDDPRMIHATIEHGAEGMASACISEQGGCLLNWAGSTKRRRAHEDRLGSNAEDLLRVVRYSPGAACRSSSSRIASAVTET